MFTKNRRVPGEVVEVVHDDRDEEVEHEEAAEEDEGHEEHVGQFVPAHLAKYSKYWEEGNHNY